jgi:hypothetical protein
VLSPNFSTIESGLESGCASAFQTLKYGLRTSVICLLGAYCVHLSGPVPGGGIATFFVGVDFGRMNANGIASWSRNSGSPRARLNVMFWPLILIPDSEHVFGVFTHASPPLIALYQLPAFGLLPILNRRSNVNFTSCGVSGVPSENLIPFRNVNVYVLPPFVGFGTDSARSGTILVPSAPPARLNATSPSWVRIKSCHSCSV